MHSVEGDQVRLLMLDKPSTCICKVFTVVLQLGDSEPMIAAFIICDLRMYPFSTNGALAQHYHVTQTPVSTPKLEGNVQLCVILIS